VRPPVQPSESEENYEKIPDKFMGDGKIEHPNYFNGKMINPNQLEFTNVTNKYSLPPVPRFIFNPYEKKLERAKMERNKVQDL